MEAFYLRAFRELSTDRKLGEVAGPIPWSSIQQYLNNYRFLDADSFTIIIRELDDAYLGHKSGSSKTFTRDMLKR